MKLRVMLVLLAFALLGVLPRLAWSQPKLQALTVSYSSVAGTETALWVTEDAGLFKKHGLDVTLKRLPGSSLVVQAMLGKEIAIAQIGGTAVVDARLAGADLVYLASVIDTMVASIYAVPGISRIEDLKGKKIGVTRAGSITDFFARYALKTKGLVPDKDVGIVQTNDLPNTLSSMKIGAVQAGVVVAPVTLQARKLGFSELLDMTKIGGAFPFNGIVATREFVKNEPETLRRFLRAYVEGIHFALQNHEQTLKIIGKYARTSDPEVLEETYQVNVAKAFRTSPFPTAQGFKTILDLVGETRDPKAKNIDPKSIIDPSFIKELDESGFIKGLR